MLARPGSVQWGTRLPGLLSARSYLRPLGNQFMRGLNTQVVIENKTLGFLMEGAGVGAVAGKELREGRKLLNIPQFWLRDNCKCPSCVNQDTLQRNYDTFQIPPTIQAVRGETNPKGVHITWSDGHESLYPWIFVNQVTRPGEDSTSLDPRRVWNADALEKIPHPEVSYNDCISENSQGSQGDMSCLMSHLRASGLCFITDTPVTPEATEKLLGSIGPIRNTHYGGFYDFIPDLSSADTAYTNLELAPHTDTTYFTDPAGLQAFHMLSHEAPPGNSIKDGELGGLSILVDGLMVAEMLRKDHPKAFETLRRVPVAWHASGNADASITPDKRYPVIETAGDSHSAPIHRIRWNNDDRGVVPIEEADEWYDAASKWDAAVKSPAYQFKFQLEPGRVLVFDNWRVLHGRTAFEGLRRICGAYINRDDFHSRWKLSRFKDNPAVVFNHNQFQ